MARYRGLLGVWFGPGLGSVFDSIRGSIRFGAEFGWDCVKFGVMFAEPSPNVVRFGVHVGFCLRYRVRSGLRFDSERDTARYRFRFWD